MLFDTKERTRTAPKRPGEDDFSFYDSSARPEFQVYRDLVNGWVNEFPDAERDELIARMRKNDSLGYQAALAEVTIHAALIRQGYTVEVHPPCPHPTRRPDFLVKNSEGNAVAYVEVTTFGPAQELVGQSNREAAIYNAIDRTNLPPGFRLSYDVVSYGQSTPNVGTLCREIETWAAASQQDDPDVMPTRIFEADDWRIEIGLIGGFRKDVLVERSIGGAMGDARFVSPDAEIREALKKKGSRYGEFASPYVIVVVDCKEELAGGDSNDEALLEAAFGTTYMEVTTYASGAHTAADRRENNGYFGRPDNPRHPNVSGTILLPRPHLWDLRQDRWQPLLLKNPWARHQIPNGFLPLPGYEFCGDQDAFVRVAGTRLADILRLPDVWPPEETRAARPRPFVQ